MDGPDLTFREGDWELAIYYRRKSTPIEFQHGVLRCRGELVCAQEADVEIETPLGLLQYFGEKETWSLEPTGWNFADRRVGPSWFGGRWPGKMSEEERRRM